MTVEGRHKYGSLSEAVQEKPAKPPLGPPHDAYATAGSSLTFSAALFCAGRANVVGDPVGWIGMIVSFAAAIAFAYYFMRAYGLASRGWGNVSFGSALASYFGFMFVLQFVPAALYEQYFHQSLLGYSVSCLAVAALPIAVLRASLGPARHPDAEPTD